MRRNATRIATAAAMFLAATACGFLISSQFGEGWLRIEVEKQLTRVLRGEVVVGSARVVVGDGLWLKGTRAEAYPTHRGHRAGAAILSAERLAARIDILAMLTGRLRLRELELEGLQLRLERFSDGSWNLPPLQAVLDRRPPRQAGDLEGNLGILRASEAITRSLLARPIAANRVQIHYATVTFIDHAVAADGAPLSLHLRGIEGRLEHNWLTDESDLLLRAQLADSVGRRSHVEVSGRRRDSQSVTLAATDLPLAMLGPYLAQTGPQASVDGTLSGTLAYRTPTAEHGVVELDWIIRNLKTSVPLRSEPLRIESPRLRVQSRLELHPGRLRVAELELDGLGGTGELSANGVVERPLRESSRARISTALRGTGLSELRKIVSWLPDSDAKPLTRLLERLERGRIDRIQASGGARLSQWRRLARGELEAMPPGFVLAADVAGIAVATDGAAALTDLRAHAEWSGDRISLRQLTANWNGVPLSRVDANVEGVSRLLRGPQEARDLQAGAAPLPGLGTLWRVLTRGRRASGTAPFPAMQLAIEELDHPALRWPIRNTRVQIAPTPEGLTIHASDGRWAGVPFRGEAVWVRQPEPHWNIAVSVQEPLEANAAGPERDRDAQRPRRRSHESGSEWFSGQLRVGSLQATGLPVSSVEARFAFTGSTLRLSDFAGQLAPTGRLNGNLSVDLARRLRLAVHVDAEMLDGDLAQIAPLVGLGRNEWKGRLSFRAALQGWVDAERPILAELSGPVYVLSREGELRREIPMVLALAQATEGFNPFASRQLARYESVEMTLQLDKGRLSTEDLTLEGPIRVYAKGFMDVARPSARVEAVVGVFLFRHADRVLGRVPVISHLVSDHGLVGGYFELTGSVKQPGVRSLPLNSIAAAVPDVVKAPFRAIGRLIGGRQATAPPASPSADWPSSAGEWHESIGHGIP